MSGGESNAKGQEHETPKGIEEPTDHIWNLERSRQTPNIGYHADDLRRRTSAGATLEAVDGSRLGGFFVQVEGLCAEGGVLVLELNRKCLSSGINYI